MYICGIKLLLTSTDKNTSVISKFAPILIYIYVLESVSCLSVCLISDVKITGFLTAATQTYEVATICTDIFRYP